jgi:hypothetical protein
MYGMHDNMVKQEHMETNDEATKQEHKESMYVNE